MTDSGNTYSEEYPAINREDAINRVTATAGLVPTANDELRVRTGEQGIPRDKSGVYAMQRAEEIEEERKRLRLIFDSTNVMALALYDAQTAGLIMGNSRYLDLVAHEGIPSDKSGGREGIETRSASHDKSGGRDKSGPYAEGPYDSSKLIGRPFQELTFVVSSEQAMTLWNTALESRASVRLPEVRCDFTSDEQETVWDWSITPILGTEQSETVRFMLVSMFEITEQVLARQEMEQLNRLKDEFLSLASHELRTPLSAIKGNAELLRRNLKRRMGVDSRATSDAAMQILDSDQEAHMLERIIGQVDHMNKLIGEMLDMTRIRADVLELENKANVNLIELARRVVEQYASTTSRPLRLHTGQEAITGNWDEARLEQVLHNLISNAIKYSPADKPVTIGIGRRPEPAQEVIVWVYDEGYGISKEEQTHIFDRFYRAHASERAKVEGLGLGLYIAHKIITRHGGRMWLRSEPGAGSTFYFSLPL